MRATQEVIDAAGCFRCDAAVGEACKITPPADGEPRIGVHYVRWVLAIGLDHDPGDEDRSVSG